MVKDRLIKMEIMITTKGLKAKKARIGGGGGGGGFTKPMASSSQVGGQLSSVTHSTAEIEIDARPIVNGQGQGAWNGGYTDQTTGINWSSNTETDDFAATASGVTQLFGNAGVGEIFIDAVNQQNNGTPQEYRIVIGGSQCGVLGSTYVGGDTFSISAIKDSGSLVSNGHVTFPNGTSNTPQNNKNSYNWEIIIDGSNVHMNDVLLFEVKVTNSTTNANAASFYTKPVTCSAKDAFYVHFQFN
jgi:hypothetical protein